MKIIHCADLHLDSQMTANLTKEQARERKREIIRTFTRMVEYAEKTGVRLIMISGDLFDTRNVSALARNTVRDMICTHPQIDFLYLRGNHDSDNFLSKLEEVPDNLLLFSDTWTAYRYGNIVISGIELSENNRATVYNSLVLGHEDFNIVMMHGQAGDYACRTQAENISLNQLKNKNIDYELDKNDYTKKIDGTDSDVANDSYAGNAMVGIPKVYWKIVNNGDNIVKNFFIKSTPKRK